VAGAENRHASVMSDPLPASLRGQLLVAAPVLVDPNFRRTVVLVGEHGEEGAMGVVLNRPSGVSVAEAVEPLVELVGGDEPVFVGGPVQPEAIVVLGEFEHPEHAASLVLGEVGFLSGEIESGEDVGPLGRVRVFAGYAGWGPGQLEAELVESSWIVEPALPDDVFAVEPDALWSDVLRRKGGPYAVLSLMPPDPSLN
jgi:putative transcriptional regulator